MIRSIKKEAAEAAPSNAVQNQETTETQRKG